jgi:hypothetical protein
MNNTNHKSDGMAMAETMREIIRHEDELVNNRITWLSQLQGLLFATLGFAWDKQDAHLLIYGCCIVGSLIALSSLIALASGDEAINRTIYWWDIHKPDDYHGPDIIGLTINALGDRQSFLLRIFFKEFKITKSLYPWYFLPRLFIAAWIVVAILNYFR